MGLCILFIQLKEAKHVIISCIRLFIIVGSLQILIQWNNKSLSKNNLICCDCCSGVEVKDNIRRRRICKTLSLAKFNDLNQHSRFRGSD